MRIFVAEALPESLHEQLAALLRELCHCGADVRWIDPASMHLTLKFLGNVHADALAPIDEVLRRVAATAPATRGRLRGIGSFPHLRRPRVIWLGLEPLGDHLKSLQTSIERGLEEIGFAAEKRPFHPHITLGRVRGGGGRQALLEAIQAHRTSRLGDIRIDELTLFESKLGRRGARYSPLATYRLRGAPGASPNVG
ncbi:MAG: RNA 2',3'-cyclic phosphodiesterase [Acidobacteriota bacterium]